MGQNSEIENQAENMRFQQKEWLFQRIGWALMLLLIVAAMLGLTGPGLLSNVTLGDENSPVRIQYNRFDHWHRDGTMILTIHPSVVQDGAARIWLSKNIFEKIDHVRLHPMPESMHLSGDRVIYTFKVAQPNAPMMVQFAYEPNAMGMTRGRIGTDEYDTEFWQWIYP